MPEPTTMTRYVSITYVNATKIKGQEPTENSYGSPWRLIPDDIGQSSIIVPSDFMASNSPKNGGYYVISENGQPFYLSAEAFEAAYTKA